MIKSRTTWNAGIFVLTLLALVPLAPYVSPYLPSFMKAAIPGFVKEAYHSVRVEIRPTTRPPSQPKMTGSGLKSDPGLPTDRTMRRGSCTSSRI